VIGDLPGDGILMHDLGPAFRAGEDDLQIGLKLPRRDMVQKSACRAGNVSPVVSHTTGPSFGDFAAVVVAVSVASELELPEHALDRLADAFEAATDSIIHDEWPPTGDAEKLELRARFKGGDAEEVLSAAFRTGSVGAIRHAAFPSAEDSGTAIEGAGVISVTGDPAKESALADRPDLKLDRSGHQIRRCGNRIDDLSGNRDGSSTRRANELDLSQGPNLPDPDNMSGSAGWTANDASVCGHITRRDGRGNRSPASVIAAAAGPFIASSILTAGSLRLERLRGLGGRFSTPAHRRRAAGKICAMESAGLLQRFAKPPHGWPSRQSVVIEHVEAGGHRAGTIRGPALAQSCGTDSGHRGSFNIPS
jgi:hypothetical protein